MKERAQFVLFIHMQCTACPPFISPPILFARMQCSYSSPASSADKNQNKACQAVALIKNPRSVAVEASKQCAHAVTVHSQQPRWGARAGGSLRMCRVPVARTGSGPAAAGAAPYGSIHRVRACMHRAAQPSRSALYLVFARKRCVACAHGTADREAALCGSNC